MTSISAITGTGLKKCSPMKRAGSGGARGHPGDRDRAGVAGEDRLGAEHLAGRLEDRLLDLLALGRGLDDQPGLGHRRVVGRRGDARERGLGVGGFELAPSRPAARARLPIPSRAFSAMARSTSASTTASRLRRRAVWRDARAHLPAPMTPTACRHARSASFARLQHEVAASVAQSRGMRQGAWLSGSRPAPTARRPRRRR